MGRFFKVVLTGGPCAGKTSAQSLLQTTFENLGWKVFMVPEAATILLNGGVVFTDLDEEMQYQFQANLLKTMISIEDTFFKIAERMKANTDVIVFCDRGAMDAFAYTDKKHWSRLEQERDGWNVNRLRDSRYDCCVHLTTAANGAEKYYQTENNRARKEAPELACFLDGLVEEAWLGHPYHAVIDNSTGFQEKLQRVTAVIMKHLDINYPVSSMVHKRKFLIKSMPDQFPVKTQVFQVEHDYLLASADGCQARVRKRGQNNRWTYTHTVRQKVIDGEKRVEVKRTMLHREYIALLQQRDPNHISAIKTRTCFTWDGNHYYIDKYERPCFTKTNGLMLMECYSTKGADLKLPDFLVVDREVTQDDMYSMFHLTSNTGSLKLLTDAVESIPETGNA